MAEKKLESIRDALLVLSDVQNMDETNPIVTRISNSTVRRVQTVVCAVREPVQEILPLNVVWFDFNPLSAFYKEARRRVSKTPSVAEGTEHTWEVIDTMAQFEEDQFYDDEDAAILNQDNPLPIAGVDTLGIVRLSVAPTSPTKPIAVGEGDKRLTDDRVPTEHSHLEKPATMLKTKNGVVNIGNSPTPVVGATLIAVDGKNAVWRQLTTNDIQR